MGKRDTDGYSTALMIVGAALLLYSIYYGGYGALRTLGLTHRSIDIAIAIVRHSGLVFSILKIKALALLLFCIGLVLRIIPSEDDSSPLLTAALLLLGIASYMAPVSDPYVFIALTLIGFILSCKGISMVWNKLGIGALPTDPQKDTFLQCSKKLENRYSINIQTRYQHKGRRHHGWINVVNPFRGTLILGTPGSGKSYSVYGPFMKQMIQKGYTMFVYDYKYPDLTQIVYNQLYENLDKYPVRPQFYTIDFQHPQHSHRCNPMHARYIKDPADSAEVAEIIMLNIAPGKEQKNDFFDMSAKNCLDASINYLSRYEGGRYCTFAHLVEFACRDYRDILRIMAADPVLEVKMAPFISALEGGAQDQLQGQIASATIPLAKFASPEIYWVLSGDDFTLDINDPQAPKIVCVGNDPKRQAIYGTTLALYTSRLCKTVNEKGKLHSGVLLDELPTIFVKGLDNLIATARSNKVAVVLGAQDRSQLVRDYGTKESDVIFNTVGNLFSGQVNGDTASKISKSFGKEFRERRSQSHSVDSQSETISKQLEDRLPVSTIETLGRGEFCGKVADYDDLKSDEKFFHAEIIRPHRPTHDYWSERPPVRKFDGDMAEEINRNFLQIKQDVENIIRESAERYGIILEADRARPNN